MQSWKCSQLISHPKTEFSIPILDMETPLPIESFVTTICSIEHLIKDHITLYVPVFEDLSIIGLDSQNTLDDELLSYYNESNKRIVYGNVTLIFQFS